MNTAVSSSSHSDGPFLPLLSSPRTRQPSATSTSSSNSSIWAPQPHSPGCIWPNSLLPLPSDRLRRPSPLRLRSGIPPSTHEPPLTVEDVFGSSEQTVPQMPRTVGAIGDGRRKAGPNYFSNHIEQMLHSMHLDSPAAQSASSRLDLNFDMSPASSASLPVTPQESSPITPSDLLLPSEYDSHYMPPYHSFSETVPIKSSHDLSLPSVSTLPQPQTSRASPHHSPAYVSTPFFDSTNERLLSQPASRNCYYEPRHSAQQWPRRQASFQTTDRRPHNSPPCFDSSTVGRGHHIMPESSGIRSYPTSPMEPYSTPSTEPINFLSLLHPSSSPPYVLFVSRVVKSSDQQASIFLQQKLKIADSKERSKIVDAICTRGYEMMAHRFGNWAVQRCLEAASSAEERRKIANCMRGRVVELAMNCYGCHVLQKALDCEEDIRLLVVSELLLGDPALTLVNKHASHVWSKIMELSWTPPAPPIFAYVNKALRGKWAALACHETGSLVVQHAFENLEQSAKEGIIDELLNRGFEVFAEVTKNQWGSYCIQHILEHGSFEHQQAAISHLIFGLLEFSTNEQGYKSVAKALKEGGREILDKIVKRMCEPPEGGRRAIMVDLALSSTGSQLIATILPNTEREQRSSLYDAIRGHIVTLRGCKTGSKVIWLLTQR